MYVGLMIVLVLAGSFCMGFCGLLFGEVQAYVPLMFRFLMFMFGLTLVIVGMMMLIIRIKKIGADHLIAPGRPGSILWFYIYGDGEVRITPAMRAGEMQLYNPDMEAQVIDVKTYSLGDHKVRFVPEVLGHAVDMDYILYANVLKTKYGFENLREVRDDWRANLLKKVGFKLTKPIIDKENFISGAELKKASQGEII